MYRRLAVLRHDESVLVVFIGDSKSGPFESVKQAFFRIAVVVESFVIINMIAREVGEQRAIEI